MKDLIKKLTIDGKNIIWCNVCNKPVEETGIHFHHHIIPRLGSHEPIVESTPYRTFTIKCHGESFKVHMNIETGKILWTEYENCNIAKYYFKKKEDAEKFAIRRIAPK